MTPSTKVFSILSLSASIGIMMAQSKDDKRPEKEMEMIHWRGEKLSEAGFHATQSYPFPPLTKSKLNQVADKVSEICNHGGDLSIVEMLAFLIAGLTDIRAYLNPENWVFLDPVLTRAAWAMELFDPGYKQEDIHAEAFERFERWAA